MHLACILLARFKVSRFLYSNTAFSFQAALFMTAVNFLNTLSMHATFKSLSLLLSELQDRGFKSASRLQAICIQATSRLQVEIHAKRDKPA
jgi:hypothetical protein